jgi:hypothetical protein
MLFGMQDNNYEFEDWRSSVNDQLDTLCPSLRGEKQRHTSSSSRGTVALAFTKREDLCVRQIPTQLFATPSSRLRFAPQSPRAHPTSPTRPEFLRNENMVSKGKRAREVLLVGSIPLRPVEKVFETVARHLGQLAPRIPDGEMMLWLRGIWKSHEHNPALMQVGFAKPNGRANSAGPIYRLRAGLKPADLELGPYGYIANAVASYTEFKRLRAEGKIPQGTRLQVTMPGPGTSAFTIQMDAEDLLPIARKALLIEINGILEAIPPEDLTVQLDVAMEAEKEEYLRRPAAFDTPIQTAFYWSHEQMADSVAWLANKIPSQVELGFHICSIWHHWPDSGQDNEVLVDTVNALSKRLKRPMNYVHIPIIPEHDHIAAYLPLGKLKLPAETKLFLGLINQFDGLEGAKKRIALAEQVVADFGVASYCGLGFPALDGDVNTQLRHIGLHPVASAELPSSSAHPGVNRATADTIDEVLLLHRKVAEC